VLFRSRSAAAPTDAVTNSPSQALLPPRTAAATTAPASRVHMEMALLRMSQRLLGLSSRHDAGPGHDVLRLFASGRQGICLDEFLDAVSVLPLGISRAEVQAVFVHLLEIGGRVNVHAQIDYLSFERLFSAAEAATSAGLPPEAAALECIDRTRLRVALQRFALPDTHGRASPQEFRVALMQAERYLTHSQLQWLTMLTDKDGEGRLLPWTLIVRLGGNVNNSSKVGPVVELPFPVAVSRGGPVAPKAPRSLVVMAALARVRDRLLQAGPQLQLERIISLFFIAPTGDKGASDVSVKCEVLISLLSHLRLGISSSEAREVVSYISGCKGTAGNGNVQLSGLFDAVQRAGDPESAYLVNQLREFATHRLTGRGALFLSGLSEDRGDCVPEAKFRYCLSLALMGEAQLTGQLKEDEEDRMLLLAEKGATGDVQWKSFMKAYAGLQEIDIDNDSEELPCRVDTRSRNEGQDPISTQQSWRSMKTAQVSAQRVVVSPMAQVTEREPACQRGLCPCRRRQAA